MPSQRGKSALKPQPGSPKAPQRRRTFGACDPVDGIWGLRVYILPQAAVDIGYRYMLNLSNATDRNGFVIKVGISNRPF